MKLLVVYPSAISRIVYPYAPITLVGWLENFEKLRGHGYQKSKFIYGSNLKKMKNKKLVLGYEESYLIRRAGADR